MPRLVRNGRELRLTFCTNVLPTATVDDLRDNLSRILPPVQTRLADELGDAPFGLGLWIPASAAERLTQDAGVRQAFGDHLRQLRAEVFTLNGFPYGDFHAERVKEEVFRPSWAEPARLRYTQHLGELLVDWIAEGEAGSISTLPCGKKSLHREPSFVAGCATNLLRLAARWHRVREATGRTLVLGLEPEPGGTIETVDELLAFYRDPLLAMAPSVLEAEGIGAHEAEIIVRRHLGVCFDTCHQAVQFDAVERSLDALEREGIPVAKMQISNALHVERPGNDPERLATLRQFAEPRYLHQVGCQSSTGVAVNDDLEHLLPTPGQPWRDASAWRIHFHVPVHRETVSGFGTTTDELRRSVRHALAHDLTRHFEVETYTWGVMPQEARVGDALIEGLADEMRWTLSEIDRLV